MTVMDRRALVLGGGGVTGIAWETGLIAGLAALDIDLAGWELKKALRLFRKSNPPSGPSATGIPSMR